MAIRVVCFDLGGVVVRIHGAWEEAAERIGVFRGVPVPWQRQSALAMWRQVHLTHHLGGVSAAQYFEQVSLLSEGFYSATEIEAIHRGWLIEEYPGMQALVAQLNTSGLITACLSNTNDYHWTQMLTEPAFPTLRTIQHRFASHEMRLVKPDPAIFAAAVTAIGSQSGEVLFFDDLPENVAAARAAGWHAEQIDPRGSSSQQIKLLCERYEVQLIDHEPKDGRGVRKAHA